MIATLAGSLLILGFGIKELAWDIILRRQIGKERVK